MRRYLTLPEVESALNRDNSVEVFLGRINEDPEVISWLSVERSGSCIVVTQYDVYDEGDIEFVDVYSFSYVDPDMDWEEYSFDELAEAVMFIKSRFKLAEVNFVNEGLVQEEFRDLLMREK